MKKRTRNIIITACVAVVAAAAVLVGVFVGKPMVERQQVEQEFAAIQQRKEEANSNPNLPASRKLVHYDEGIPLSEIDTNDLEIYLPKARAAIATPLDSPEEEAYHLPLPVDVNYYSSPDSSGKPAYTIPQGTEVLLYDNGEIDPYDPAPYGCVCYPDYQKGWRYGAAFLTMDSGMTISEARSNDELPYYYVRTEDLRAVLGAYYDKYQERFSAAKGREDYIDTYAEYIDHTLFTNGDFCSPELERLWDGYVTVAEQTASQEKE